MNSIRMMAIVGLGAACCVAAPAKKWEPADFLGFWLEERREDGSFVYDKPDDLTGWDLNAKTAGCWGRRGESVYSEVGRLELRLDQDPIWLDIVGKPFLESRGNEWVEKVPLRAGIVKRDGKKLIWVWAKQWTNIEPKELATWSKRPTSFDIKKGDPWEKMTLYRTTGGYYTQD